MRIPLDHYSQLPLYRQIECFLHEEIDSGALQTDTKLPSTRELANSLGVNRITVINAYAELEAKGLVYTKLGSGTYVAYPPESLPDRKDQETDEQRWPLWQQQLSHKAMLPGELEKERIGLVSEPSEDLIWLAGGQGAVDLFPADDFRKSLQSILLRDKTEAMGYGDDAGYLPLRATIAHILANQGIHAHPKDILITTGSQQALSLVANLLLRPGDVVLLESPTYSGAIDLFTSEGAQLVGVPVDENGMQVERIEALLRTYHPKLIYTIPTFHNPTGACMSGTRRRQLVALAKKYNAPILEDEFVGDLRYDGRAQPALKSLDCCGDVIYTGTFSKMLMPGIRVGYLLASGPVYERLRAWKHTTDLASSNLIQRALEAYISVGRYQTHLNRARRIYRRRRDAAIAALHKYMPDDVEWITPQGGLFIWLKLPDGVTDHNLYASAISHKVAFAPGSLFFPAEKSRQFLRLNFVMHPGEIIAEGIRRLSEAISNSLGIASS